MGLLSNVFGGREEYAPLDPSRAAAARIEAQRAILEEMAGPARDELELGPGEEMVLVFVGQPPDRLRVAWLADGDEQNVEGLFFEKGMTDRDLQRISDFLRVAYERHQREPRFTAVLAGRKLTVSPGPLMLSIAHS